MLADDVAAVLYLATQAPPRTTTPSGAAVTAPRYADDLAPITPPRGDPSNFPGYIWIQDVLHPWVKSQWIRNTPIPVNWILTTAPPGAGKLGSPTTSALPSFDFSPQSRAITALVRLAAARTVSQDAARRQRDARDAKRADRAERRRIRDAERVTPGAGSPFRIKRGPRFLRARVPLRNRRPRRPRTNGTKNAKPAPPCKKKNSLGQCVQRGGCTPDAIIPKPNEGHSSCNWAPVDSCGNCVQAGCTGPAAFLLKPFLALLPKYWTAESVTLAQQQRQALKQTKRGGIQFAKLPPLTPGANRLPPGPRQIDPRALTSGCACQDWPGWIICPNCTGGALCICRGTCIAFPARTGNCATT